MTEKKKLSQIELDFLEAVKVARPLIEEKIAAAMKLIGEAERISEEYGVPFYSYVSPLGQAYKPSTMPAVNLNALYECVEGFDDSGMYAECDGWQHSAVCY